MQFFFQFVIGLIALQASWIWADPFINSLNVTDIVASRGEDDLVKRNYNINLNFDSSVSAGDQAIITQGFQDMQTLATAAANYDFSNTAGNIDGIYRRYFPQGNQLRVQALFRYLAGIPQTWGGVQRTTPDFSQITIRREKGGLFTQAYVERTALGHSITFTDFGMRTPPTIQSLIPFTETKTSSKFEMLGAVILHELLHCETEITAPILYFDGPQASAPQVMTINDQSLNVIGIKETAYGGYLATKLKDQNGPLALLNNDNWMYFALEAYWYPIVGPHGIFAPPDRECLKGCINLFQGLCLWCWQR